MLSSVFSVYGALPQFPGEGWLAERFLPPFGTVHGRRMRTRFGIRFECDLDDRSGRELYYYALDAPDVRALRRIVPRNGVVLDVGANIGYYSLLFAKWGAEVHAFEPYPGTARKLRRNLELNAALRVSAWEFALSDREGYVSMAIPDPTNSGANYVTTGPGAIKVTTLDAFARAHGLERVDFIKVDIEGSEAAFLEGGAETIRRFRPMLMVELNPSALEGRGRTTADVVELLGKYRYRLAKATRFGGFKPLERLPAHGEFPNVYGFPIT